MLAPAMPTNTPLATSSPSATGDTPAIVPIRRWFLRRRYRDIVQQLRGLAPQDLRALSIPVSEIDRLACQAARTYRW